MASKGLTQFGRSHNLRENVPFLNCDVASDVNTEAEISETNSSVNNPVVESAFENSAVQSSKTFSNRRPNGTEKAVEVCSQASTEVSNQNRQARNRNNQSSGLLEGRELADRQLASNNSTNLHIELERTERRALARSPLCSICGGTSRPSGIENYLCCRSCHRIFLASESIQAVVAQGGGVFCGIFPGDYKNPTLALFQSRSTGNTLAVPLLFLTVTSVRQAISESDQQFRNTPKVNACL